MYLEISLLRPSIFSQEESSENLATEASECQGLLREQAGFAWRHFTSNPKGPNTLPRASGKSASFSGPENSLGVK